MRPDQPRKPRKSQTPKPNRPRRHLSRDAFDRELRRVLAGDPDADTGVRAFWDDYCERNGVMAAIAHKDAVEVLRGPRPTTSNSPER
ncbi:hypothetical protein OG984_02880 [Nocardioides sp. NBC_00368]|uniref:hypothetical protein n=1 Tax=Nocardioides sp. NBC_00368 TaxID=2976000 RepID=UPI002E1CBD9A